MLVQGFQSSWAGGMTLKRLQSALLFPVLSLQSSRPTSSGGSSARTVTWQQMGLGVEVCLWH